MRKHLSVEHLEQRRFLCGSSIVSEHLCQPIMSVAHASRSMSEFSLVPEYDLGELEGTRRIRGSVGGNDRVDLYGFQLRDNAAVELNMQGRWGQRLTLLDSQMNVVDENVVTGNAVSIDEGLAAGNYFVAVRGYAWNAARYQLQIEVQSTIPDRAGNTLAEAYQLGNVTDDILYGHVGAADTADVFQISIDRLSTVDIRLDGLASDVDLYFLDEKGRIRVSSRNSRDVSESVHHRFGAGSYYAVVHPYGEAISAYRLQIDVSPVLENPEFRPITPSPGASPPNDVPVPGGNEEGETANDLAPVSYFGGVNDWNLNSVDAPESWAAGYTGEDVIVAVVDTGIDLQHADLNENIWRNVHEIPGDHIDNDRNGFVDDVYGWNFASGNNNPDDVNGHGTHVAGTIAAQLNGNGATGVAYDATVMPVKVLGNNGAGSDYSVASGIRYAVDNGADVINLSLGSNSDSQRIRSALEYALANDVFIVAASGNEGAAVPGYPAIHSRDLGNVISVGAHDRNGISATFNNAVGASRASQIDAPGVQIFSTLPGNRYGVLSGTSMAAPHVSAVAALTLSANPDLTSRELKALLTQRVGIAARGSDARGAVDASLVVARARQHDNVSTSSANLAGSQIASIDTFFANGSLS